MKTAWMEKAWTAERESVDRCKESHGGQLKWDLWLTRTFWALIPS